MDIWSFIFLLQFINVSMDKISPSLFIVRPENTTVRIGDSVTLGCKTTENSIYYTWEFKPYKDWPRKESSVVGFCYKWKQCVVQIWTDQVTITNTSHLMIRNISSANSGQYICETTTSNGHEIIKTSAWIFVKTPPKSVSIEFNKSQNLFNENEPIIVKCTVAGSNPAAEVSISIVTNNEVTLLKSQSGKTMFFNMKEVIVSEIWKPSYLQNRGFIMCTASNDAGTLTRNSSRVNVMFEPKIHPFKSNNISAVINQTIDLICIVTANPLATITWFINNGLRLIESTQLITKVQPEMAGNITCTAENAMGSRSQSLKLVVLKDPQIRMKPHYKIRETSDGSVACNVEATPEPDFIKWYKVSSNPENHLTLISNDAKLNFIKIDRSSAGKYACVTKNTQRPTYGPVKEVTKEKYLDLIVTYLPGEPLTKSDNDIKVLKGDQLRILCSANNKNPGEPFPTLSWIDVETRETVFNSAEYFVENVGSINSGNYQCVATNELGVTPSLGTVLVTVNEPPVVVSHQKSNVFLSHSFLPQSVTFPCTFQGYPLHIVTWQYQRSKISSAEYYEITTHRSIARDKATMLSSNLTIKLYSPSFPHNFSAKMPPSGIYSCETMNQFGTASYDYYLLVKYPPLIKINTHERKVAGSLRQESITMKCQIESIGELQIAWFRSTDQMEIFNTDPKYYIMTNDIVKYNVAVDMFAAGVKVTELKIFNLVSEDFTSYSCVASNDQGSTKGTIELVFKSKPDVPSDIHVDDIEWDSITICWKSGFNGGVEQNFEIHVYSDDLGQHNIPFFADKIDNKLTLKGLHPNTNYSVQIYSMNALGRSGGSVIINCVTKRINKFDNIQAWILPDQPKVVIIVPNSDLCANLDYSRDNGRQWFNLQHCIRFNNSQVNTTVPIDIRQLTSAYDVHDGTVHLRVIFCLVSRPGICSDPMVLDNPKNVFVTTQTVILIISVVCVILIIILIILFIVCCIRFKYRCTICYSYCYYLFCCRSKYQRPKMTTSRTSINKRMINPGNMVDGQLSYDENFDDTLITMGSPSNYCSSLMGCSSPHMMSKQLLQNNNDIYSSFTCQHQTQAPTYYEGSSFLQPTMFSWPQNLSSQTYEVSSSNSHSSAGSSSRTNNPKSCIKYRANQESLSKNVIINQKSLIELNERMQLPDVTSEAIHFIKSSDTDHVLEAIV